MSRRPLKKLLIAQLRHCLFSQAPVTAKLMSHFVK
jgi:hypothetical protein